MRPGTGFSVGSPQPKIPAAAQKGSWITKSGFFPVLGAGKIIFPGSVRCSVCSLLPSVNGDVGGMEKTQTHGALCSSKDEIEDYFLLFVVQSEEEHETSLPFFNQLSHLGPASIVMTRGFGKGSGFAQFVKEGDIGLEGFLFVCLLASKK